MMEKKTVCRYMRAVSRKLICSHTTRSKLLDGLRQELSAYSSLTYNELCETVGNPAQIAEQLMESVSEAEISATKRKHQFIIAVVLGISIVLLLTLTAYYIYAQQVVHGDFYLTRTNTESGEQVVSDGMLKD